MITQAVALQARGDRHVYSHVAFLSRLDTLFNMTARSYFTHAYLEGTDDYLGALGASVWEVSEINFIEGGGILFAGAPPSSAPTSARPGRCSSTRCR